MSRRAALVPIMLAVTFTATASACSSTHHATSSAASTGSGQSINGMGSGSYGMNAGSANDAVGQSGGASPLDAAKAAPPASGPIAASAKPLPTRALIQTAAITVKVSSIGAADQVDKIATDVGAAIDGDDRTSGKDADATIVLEVPPRALATVLTAVAKLGTEQSRNLSTQDVTTQVADVNSRVKSARDAIARLQALFAQASGINDVITIENQLDQREANLESLEAQQRALASQTAMAKLTVHLTTAAPAPKPTPKKHHGFAGGLHRGWHNFSAFVASTLTGIALIGPFAILFALLAALGVVLASRVRQLRRSARPVPVLPSGSADPQP